MIRKASQNYCYLSDYSSNVHNIPVCEIEDLWVLYSETKQIVDPPVTSVEFVTSVLAATPGSSSHPTWGIEV